MAKILIIKLGYSETLDGYIDERSSLGDVLRTTVMLHVFKDDEVTWLTDRQAYPILLGNKYIKRILTYNLNSVLQLQKERFGTVINLEKVPGICAFSDSINAWRHFGFRFDETKGVAEAYDGAERVLAISLSLVEKRKNEKYWQQALMHIIGKEWNGEKYILGYKPKSQIKHDVGFNWKVGPKWPNKAWPKEYWEKLARLLKDKYIISWQEGLDNIHDYMEWINSVRVLITNDSLGMHLAIALKKKIIVLHGPTASNETYLYGLGEKIFPEVDYDCIPCLKDTCIHKKSCMYFIKPERVKKLVEKISQNR